MLPVAVNMPSFFELLPHGDGHARLAGCVPHLHYHGHDAAGLDAGGNPNVDLRDTRDLLGRSQDCCLTTDS
jgi:hypothetical protein